MAKTPEPGGRKPAKKTAAKKTTSAKKTAARRVADGKKHQPTPTPPPAVAAPVPAAKKHRLKWWHLHVSLATVAVGLLVAFLLGAFAAGGAKWVTVKVGGPHGTPTATLTVPAAAIAQAKAGLGDHANLRDQAPAAAPATVIAAAQAQDKALAANDKLPKVFPDAAPEQRGCVTRLVQDYSSRNGVAPREFVLHYTVSPNRPGWSDVNAVEAEFNTWAFQASSNYIIDAEGNCAYIVRETDKAWTQAAANPVSISVEVIDTGHESVYLPKPGLDKLAMVISDALARWKIPVQLGAFANGVLTRPGILDHRMLGAAGGGHFDIDPIIGGQFNDPQGLARVVQVIAAVKAFRAKQVAAAKPPAWYMAASKLPPMWAWISWRDHEHPAKWRPVQIPKKVPAAWWHRYAVHAGAA